ncbi:MAG: phosphoglycerate kinase [Patescibacteria group bacterium]
MKLRTLKALKNLKGKTVLVRVDYDVEIKNGKVIEPERIERSFPTINFLLKNKAKVVLMAHLDRPGGKIIKKLSLKPVAVYLDSIAKKPVQFIDDCIGERVKQKVAKMKAGQILLLENLRFYPGEEKNDAKFAQELASLADIYVNDAFANSHRTHASIVAITKFLPAYAGFNLLKEVINLSKLLKGFKKPATAIIGGVKIETKIKVIENFLKKYNYVLIGGALANNFLKAQKINIGKSVYQKEFVGLAKKLMLKAKGKLILPLDVRICNSLNGHGKILIKKISELNKIKSKNFYIVDIGLRTELNFARHFNQAKTLVWNGPMGMFEIPEFSHGSDFIAQQFAIISKGPSFGVAGGGETIALLDKLKLKTWPDFVSTAGGAMLEFLEGKVLPGIRPLLKKS